MNDRALVNQSARSPGRPQGDLRGTSRQANELAVFLRDLTKDHTVRQLAVRYMGGRTAWSMYRSGAQLIPLHLLEQVVRDRTRDQAGRELRLTRARTLHEQAAAAQPAADPVAVPELPPEAEPAPTRRSRLWLSHAAAAAVAVAATLLVATPGNGPRPTTPAPVPHIATQLVALTPTGDAVRSWDPATRRWTTIGAHAASVHGGGAGLWAISPGVGHIAQYHSPGNWSYTGERPAELVVGQDQLLRLAPDRAAVWAWVPQDKSWLLVGGQARHLYAGPAGIFASSPSGTDLFRYEGTPENWTWVTDTLDPRDTLVVGGETLYRLTAGRTEVQEWDQVDGRWRRIGGAAKTIRVGGAGLVAMDDDGGVRVYRDSPNDWRRIGDGAADVAVGADRVYRLGTDGAISEWSANTWHDLDASARAITVVGT
ncbi:hypothetical protein [Actinophytocola sediminis]